MLLAVVENLKELLIRGQFPVRMTEMTLKTFYNINVIPISSLIV